jgi:hypothetical protein
MTLASHLDRLEAVFAELQQPLVAVS